MKFQQVLDGLLEGKRYRRAGWKNALFIFLVPGSQFTVNRAPLLGIYPEGTPIQYAPHIDVVSAETVQGANHVSTWTPWMGDLLADDWEVYQTDAEAAGQLDVRTNAPTAEIVADASPAVTEAAPVEAPVGAVADGQAQAA